MASRILRQSEKNLLKGIIEGKTVKELAMANECDDEEMKQKYMSVSNTLFELFMVEHNNIGEIFKSE